MRRILSRTWTAIAALTFVLPAIASAAEPATQPTSEIDLSWPAGAIDPFAGCFVGPNTTVRVIRRSLNKPKPDAPESGLSVCEVGARTGLEIGVPGVRIGGVAPAGPGRVLAWGLNVGRPNSGHSDAAPYAGIWDLAAGREVMRFDAVGKAPVRVAAVAPAAGRVLTAGAGRPLRVWDAASGQELRAIETGHEVAALALSADGRRAVVGGAAGDEGVYVWDLDSGRELARCTGHHGAITSVAWSADERFVLSSSTDGTVRLWDAATGEELRLLPSCGLPVAKATFVAGDSRVLTMVGQPLRDDGLDAWSIPVRPGDTMRLWDLAGQTVLLRLDAPDAEMADAALSEDGTQVRAIEGPDLWSWTLPPGVAATANPPATPPAAMPAATAPAASQAASLADLSTPRPPADDPGRVAVLGTAQVDGVGFLPNGLAWAFGDDSRRVAVWDIPRHLRDLARTPSGDENYPPVAGVSADGRFALSTRMPGGGQVTVWELASGLVQLDLTPRDVSLVSAALSPDGNLLAIGQTARPVNNIRRVRPSAVTGDAVPSRPTPINRPGGASGSTAAAAPSLVFYRVADGRIAGTIDPQGRDVAVIAFSPDGSRIAVGGPGGVVTEFDLDTGRIAATCSAASDPAATRPVSTNVAAPASPPITRPAVNGIDAIVSIAYSADGRRVLGRSYAGVTVWDTKTGHRLLRLAPPAQITAAVLSPDGRRVVTGGADTNVRVVDVDSGRELACYDDPKWPVKSVAVSPDGRRIACGTGEAGVWTFGMP